MRSLKSPEERIAWLEANKLIKEDLGSELRAFAATTGMNGPAPMYGLSKEARVYSTEKISPLRSAYIGLHDNKGSTNGTDTDSNNGPVGGQAADQSTESKIPVMSALQLALAQSQIRSDHEVSKYCERMQSLDSLSENVISITMLPLSVVPNVLIDSISYTIPVSTEEPSVVAALAHGAKIFSAGKGVQTLAPISQFVLGQFIFQVDDQWTLSSGSPELDQILASALATHLPNARRYGKGIMHSNLKHKENYVLLEVELDPGEAMGANMMNGFLEKAVPEVQEYLSRFGNIQCLTTILSNTASGRIYEASAQLTVEDYARMKKITISEAERILYRISALSHVAEIEANRRITHNKGVLNGVVGVALACGQDTRAIDVANCQLGHARPLVVHNFSSRQGILRVTARIAAPVGVIGGSYRFFWGNSILSQAQGATFSSSTLGRILAAVGLLQNFAALQALVTEGIQRGHMQLHRRKAEARVDPWSVPIFQTPAPVATSGTPEPPVSAKSPTHSWKGRGESSLFDSLKRIEGRIQNIGSPGSHLEGRIGATRLSIQPDTNRSRTTSPIFTDYVRTLPRSDSSMSWNRFVYTRTPTISTNPTQAFSRRTLTPYSPNRLNSFTLPNPSEVSRVQDIN